MFLGCGLSFGTVEERTRCTSIGGEGRDLLLDVEKVKEDRR